MKQTPTAYPARKVWMKTYGCQMNYHDTERMMHQLEEMNFSLTQKQEEADLLLFNTCAIRDLANQKFYSHLGDTKKYKDVKIGVGGCIAQTDAKDLVKKYKHLNFAFGTDVIDNLKEMVHRAYEGEDKFTVTQWDRAADYSIETKITHGSPQAFVNIIKGCDKFCSYCIVPYTRGREKSRSVQEVKDDVIRLVEESGIQEVTLLGQNVNSFGKKNGETLAQLLYELDKIPGLQLIRYTTSHPYDVSDELIEAHGKCEKLSHHLHLPVQSGSNTVLQRMLRQYTQEHYLGLLEKLRKADPEIVISTDIIAGFPNETAKEHRETLDLLEKAQFDFIYAYAYSPRKGTKSTRIQDVLTDNIRGQRLREIQAYQAEIQQRIRQGMVEKTYRVLVEGQKTMKGKTKWTGRTNCWRVVHFESEQTDLQWHWCDVKITSATAFSCQSELLVDHGRYPTAITLH